jgi:hypothetical protein
MMLMIDVNDGGDDDDICLYVCESDFGRLISIEHQISVESVLSQQKKFT